MNKRDIKSMSLTALSEQFREWGEPPFRARQVFSWLHQKKASNFAEMSNISAQFRDRLDSEFYISRIKIVKKLVSSMDDTVKYLYMLDDGETIETVVMPYRYGFSICISTEVGCRMGCAFCASAKLGFVRRLTPAEMLCQIDESEKDLGVRVSRVVLMGIGEPLDNYDNVLALIRILSDESGSNLSLRHITLSTCGVADQIYRLADEKLPITLSVSLHAPNDRLRAQILPIDRAYPIAKLLRACRYYANVTHRRITFEYACMKHKNDRAKDARELAGLLRGMLCHVNLIPINPVAGAPYEASSAERILAFSKVLEKSGIPVTVRRTLGQDIQAACGQLRRDKQTEDVK